MATLCVLVVAARARAQSDCDDIDHDCSADRTVARAIRRAGIEMVRCIQEGTEPCDLTAALAQVASPECRFALDCQLHALRGLIGDGSTVCAQTLLRDACKFMSRKVSRIGRARFDRVQAEVTRCKQNAARRCEDPVAPPLTGACTDDTTAAAAADCVCDGGDALSNRMLLKPGTCRDRPTPAAASTPAPLATGRAAVRPNFVLILSDDQRWDTIGPTHSVSGRDPVMPIVESELAASGVAFPNGYVTTALCCPSRTSILSGRYAHNTGVHGNGPPDGGAEVFNDTSTIGTWLRSAGYRTGFVGKYLNGYSTMAPCIPPGWDDWHVQVQVKYYDYDLNDNGVITHFDGQPADYAGDVMTRRAVEFIRSSARTGQPFFLHLSQKAPHPPATPAPRHIGLFAGLAPWRPPSYAEGDVSDKPAWVQALTWTASQQAFIDEFRIDQLESLQAVDEGVGAIMEALRDTGQDDHTLVIYTSDNGYSWGEHRWHAKQCPYEECMRVPMIMRYPPFGTVPRTDPHVVLNVDFAPTIAELAGVVPPTPVNGVSVVPLLEGTAATWRTDFLNEHWKGTIPDNAVVRGLVGKTHWKYVEYTTGETELYDEDADPLELDNVTTDPADASIKAALAARLQVLKAE